MKLRILLATVALMGSLCSACVGNRGCVSQALAEIAVVHVGTEEYDKAIELTQKLDTSTLKAVVLSQIAIELVKAGQEKQAASLLKQALQVADKIDSPPDQVMTLSAIAAQYGKAGQKDKAAEILSQAVQSTTAIWGGAFVKDTVLEKIAVQYTELGNYEQGIRIANKIYDDIPKSRALAQIAMKYVAVGDYDKARQVANAIEFNASKANALIAIAHQTGEYQQALAVAQNIDEDGSVQLQSLVLTKIARLYSQAGQKQQAAEVVSQALQAAELIEDAVSKVERLAQIASLYAQVGEKAKAIAVSSQALQIANQIRELDKKAALLAKLSVTYERIQQKALADSIFTQALQIAQTIDNEDSKAKTLATLAITSASIKPSDQVLRLIGIIADTPTQASALTQMAKGYAQAGKQQQARQALNQAFAVIQTAKTSKDKARILSDIAIESIQIAQYDRALAAAQIIDATEEDSPKALTLARIAKAYVKAGQKEKAIAILSQALLAAKETQCPD